MKHNLFTRMFVSALALGTAFCMLPVSASAQTPIVATSYQWSTLTGSVCEKAFTYDIGIGYGSWILDAIVVDSIRSTNPDIFTVEYDEDNYEDPAYVLVGHKPGTAYLKTKYTDGTSDVLKIIVHNPCEASLNEITLKSGASQLMSLDLWTAERISVKSSDKSIVTASFLETVYNPGRPTLKITGKAPGKATIKIKNSHSLPPLEIKVTVTKKDNTSPVEDCTGKRRALVIGQEYCCENRLTACPNDAAAMSRVCKNSGYTSVVKLKNASKKDIKNGIINTFKDAKKNDVSLFYYSGHGSEGGQLCSYEKNCQIKLISPKELASWLSVVPGKVIVITDSCFSGGLINKDMGNVTFKTANTNIINAFKEQDGISKAGGELSKSKFKVITACSKKQYSYCNDIYSYFTMSLIDGAGYDYTTGNKLQDAPADRNKDKRITVNESTYFISQFCGARNDQDVKSYPSNSEFVIFKR